MSGFWCCPIAGCGGAGFGCDIFPIDPGWTDEDGNRMWVEDDAPEDVADGIFDDHPPADWPDPADRSEEMPH